MAMFDVVAKGFRDVRMRFEGKRELTEQNVEDALKDIRMSMLEADVNFRITKQFINRVKEKALGEIVKVKASADGERVDVTPGDHFIRICHDELEALMGPVDTSIHFAPDRLGPTKIMMVGLQGSGKTTTTAKLARLVMNDGKKPLLVGADVYRPAAIEQLRVLGEQLGVPVHAEEGGDPVAVCSAALKIAKNRECDVVIFDTAGRLAVDDVLMDELESIVELTRPENIFLVVDAMIGQDAVNTAAEFNNRLEIDGFIMTKLDGDARGGAALSIKEVTGKPIKYVGVGREARRPRAVPTGRFREPNPRVRRRHGADAEVREDVVGRGGCPRRARRDADALRRLRFQRLLQPAGADHEARVDERADGDDALLRRRSSPGREHRRPRIGAGPERSSSR